MENGGRPIAEEEYTRQTRVWLDRRYRLSDLCGELDHEAQSGGIRGVYHAHQPVYGVWGSCCEPGRIQRYALSWHLLEALRRISFSTLLDVGAAEGFTQELIRSHFSARTFGADLSAEGCLRARGIFQTDSAAADVHRLPFRENSVDVVLCSETLEHVPDPERALEEMLRVARVAVVLSIPLEAEEIIAANRRDQVAHAHIHRFTAEAFESLRRPGLEVECRPVLSGPFLELARSLEALRPLAGETEPGRSRFGEMLRQALPLDGLLIAQGGSPHGWIVVLRKKPRPSSPMTADRSMLRISCFPPARRIAWPGGPMPRGSLCLPIPAGCFFISTAWRKAVPGSGLPAGAFCRDAAPSSSAWLWPLTAVGNIICFRRR